MTLVSLDRRHGVEHTWLSLCRRVRENVDTDLAVFRIIAAIDVAHYTLVDEHQGSK